jgi:hypothetical protein
MGFALLIVFLMLSIGVPIMCRSNILITVVLQGQATQFLLMLRLMLLGMVIVVVMLHLKTMILMMGVLFLI